MVPPKGVRLGHGLDLLKGDRKGEIYAHRTQVGTLPQHQGTISLLFLTRAWVVN